MKSSIFSSLFIKLFSIFALLCFVRPAFAEGGCPPGQYPVGGQGVVGCAPIPQAAPVQSSPVATGKWHKTWGVISVDSDTGVVAPSLGYLSKRDAVSAAKKSCKDGGGGVCDFVFPFYNQCAAIAWSEGGGYAAVGAGSEELAKDGARADCAKYGRCVIAFSGCTKPVFERF